MCKMRVSMHRVTAHSNCPSCLFRIGSVTTITVVLSFTEDNAILISSVKLICCWLRHAFLLNHRDIDLCLSTQHTLFPHFSTSRDKSYLIANTNKCTSIKNRLSPTIHQYSDIFFRSSSGNLTLNKHI